MEKIKMYLKRFDMVILTIIFSFCVLWNPNIVKGEDSEFSIEDGVLLAYSGSQSHVVIPNTVTKIGAKAFYKNDQMKTLNLPSSIVEIEEEAFSYCSSLISVSIPNTVKRIGDWAFAECKSLNSLKIGNGTESIGEWAFYSCISLKEVVLGDAITSVGKFSFKYCNKDMKIFIGANSYLEAYCNKYGYNWEMKSEESNLVSEIILSQETVNLAEGESVQLNASVFPDNATNQGLKWSSDSPFVAAVDKKGLVTATGIGSAVIRCIAKDGSEVIAECMVWVDGEGGGSTEASIPKPPTIEETTLFELSQDNLLMEIGDTEILECYVVPRQNIQFKSDNTSVAEISEHGKILAKKGGVAILSATAEDGRSLECFVRVIVQPKEMKLNKTRIIMKIGEKIRLKASFSPKGVSKELKILTWSSNNKYVATVTKEGYVKARSEGACTIQVETENGIKATCKVIIMEP